MTGHSADYAPLYPLVPAQPADALADFAGVRTISTDAAYGTDAQLVTALQSTGTRYIREPTSLPSTTTGVVDQQATWNAVHAIGVRVITRVGKPDGSEGSVADFAAYHKYRFASSGVIWAIENGNEWNKAVMAGGVGQGSGVSPITGRTYGASYPLWAEQLAVRQRQMWNAYRLDSALSSIVILGPALVSTNTTNAGLLFDVANVVYSQLNGTPCTTGIAQYCDYVQFHLYPGQAAAQAVDSVPSWKLDATIAATKLQAAGLRDVFCGEAGLHDAVNSSNLNFSAHSPAAAADYVPRMLLEHFYRGVKKMVYFELYDDGPDPGNTDQEASFGLIANDWSMKASGTAWSRMLALFSDPGTPVTPGLRMAVSGGDAATRWLLFQKRDGTALVALWRDVSVYDYTKVSGGSTLAAADLSPAAVTVTVNLNDTATVSTYKPTSSGTATAVGNVASFTVALAGEVVVAKVVPIAANPPATANNVLPTSLPFALAGADTTTP